VPDQIQLLGRLVQVLLGVLQRLLLLALCRVQDLEHVLGALQAGGLDAQMVAQLLYPLLDRRHLDAALALVGDVAARRRLLFNLEDAHLEVFDLGLRVLEQLLRLHQQLLVLRAGELAQHVLCSLLHLQNQ
jgi:hypothetical protein